MADETLLLNKTVIWRKIFYP